MVTEAKSAQTPIAGKVVDFDNALWRQLVVKGSEEAFFSSWLALQAKQLPRIVSGVIIAVDKDEVLRPVGCWPKELSPGPELRNACQSAARRRVGVIRRGEPALSGEKPTSSFAYPILLDEEVVAVAGFSIADDNEHVLQTALRRVQWGSVWLENHFRERRNEAVNAAAERLSCALDLVAVSLEHEEFGAAAISLMTEIAVRMKCERASLGFFDGRSTRVIAVSHNSELNRRQSLVRAIAAAMNEAIDQRKPIAYPARDETPVLMTKHKELAQRLGAGGPVATFPLFDEDRIFGAVTLEFPLERVLDDGDIDLGVAATALTGRIMRLRKAEDRWVLTKAVHAAARQGKRLLGPGYFGRKVTLLSAAGLTVFFALFETEYAVPATAQLEGQVQRILAAPFQSYISQENARPGDIVAKGDVLAKLDDRELQLERAAWQTRRSQYEAERQSAIAERDIGTANVKQAQIDEADVQLKLLNQRIELATIVAPFDGIVLSGDLSQGLGTNVQVGDALFQVAPLDAYRIVLSVDEEDVADVSLGQSGGLILSSRPDEVHPLVITKITSVTQVKEGRNYFRVEARLDSHSASLRPGMTGIAKITAEDRLLIWIWTRRAVNWLKVQLWKWLP